MALFLRDYRITVGSPKPRLLMGGTGISAPVLPAFIFQGSGREIRDLQIRFKIVRTASGTQNKAKFEIFNLAPATRGVFDVSDDATNNPIIIFQVRYLNEPRNGSADGFQTLFTGRVVNALTTKDGPDMITQVEAADGYVPLRDSFTSRNFPRGATRRFVLEKLIEDLQVPVGEIRDGGSLNERFENGTTIFGPTRLAIDTLLQPVNIDWSIQDDAFMAVRKDLASEESILDLTPTTGLINSPRAKKGRGNRVKNAQQESDHGVIVESLLAPAMKPNRRIRVESEAFPNGQIFKIAKVTHSGDFRGDEWSSKAECIEVNAAPSEDLPVDEGDGEDVLE